MAKNYQILIAEKNSDIAKNNYTRGEAGFYPQITFNFNNTNSFTNQNDPSSFVQGLVQSDRFTPNIDLRWVLFDGLRVQANYQQLQRLSELSEGNEIVILQSTVVAVILAYNSILLNKENLKTNRNVLKLSIDRFHYFENKKALGAAVTFDLVQAKNAMLNDSTIVVSQRLQLRKSVRQLNRLMAIDLDNSWFFTDTLVANPAPFNLSILKESMLSSNANLKVQYVNQQLKEIGIRQQKAGQYPSIFINTGANYTYNHFSGTLPRGGESVKVTTNGTTTNYYGNLTLNFNLYNGGKVRRAIKNARIDLEIASLGTDELKLSLTQELDDQFDTWKAMLEILKLARENLESAKLNIEIATEKYRNGSITSFDFRNVQKTYSLVALTKEQAEFNVIAAQTELLRLSGNILRNTDN